ncbi:unnamed protein product, partial [Iphiclides podalirius]
MWATISIFVMVIFYVAAFEFSMSPEMPQYIKKALHQKSRYKIPPKQKVLTLKNLTISDVLDRIKAMTQSLNQHARKNGYKVDYKFRILS